MNFRAWLVVAFYGVLLASVASGAVKNTRKFKIATTTTTTTSTEKPSEQPGNEASADEIEGTTATADVNATTARVLTGIPQIDYIWDPNLPRELNGFNLSDYPFYSSIPPLDEIDFKCDGLHDGFYASVPHKCQVYHHCLFGTRYDFLCANFTAFDQKTFICHFASEVDCANSKKYWHRNDALYKAATTTPPPTTTTVRTTTTTTAPPPVTDVARPAPRRRRPLRRRPAYDYYEEDYYDDEYERPRSRGSGYDRRDEYEYEERPYNRRDHMRNRERDYREPALRPRDRFPSRNNRRDPVTPVREPEDVEKDRRYDRGFPRDDYEDKPAAAVTPEPPAKHVTPSTSIYARTRPPLKPRRPTPAPQQDRFVHKTAVSAPEDSRRPPARTSEPPAAPGDDYYEDELEDMRPRRPMRRRPYRERDRHFYDQLRDMRERPAISSRTRYRDEEEETRPRKYPERPSNRDRFFERARDRALDRPKPDLPVEKPSSESRPALRLSAAREKAAKDKTSTERPPHPPKLPHDDDDEESERDFAPKPTPAPKNDKASDADKVYGGEKTGLKPDEGRVDDYVLEDEYYDEPEYSSPAPPRPAVRIVKRPFLPSRGGNPNPRGLSPVGLKATDSVRREPVINSTTVGDRKEPEENYRGADKYHAQIKPAGEDTVRYHAHKDDKRRPVESPQASKDAKWSQQEDNSEIKPAVPWNAEDYRRGHLFSSNEPRKNLIGASGPAAKQVINEVTHTLQDIPESEYDVTLNEALTPAFNQDSLPSGFILPHQRREPLLQPSENNYRVSRPNYSQQLKQKTFIPSPQFIPSTRNAANNERATSVQYFNSPEHVPGSDVAPRQTGRSPWHDYTGY